MKHLISLKALCLGLALGTGPALAHPHIFVQTGLRLIHDDQGQLIALEIAMAYDELFSLLLLEDLGLDADYDGVLTHEENARLQGFDMDWPEDFEGDVYLDADGRPVRLGPPQTGLAELDAQGRLIGRHRRALAEPVDGGAQPVTIKVYDPTFYTAYEIMPAEVATDNPDCKVEVFTPDLDAANEELLAALNELTAEVDLSQEVDFPAIGDRFAEEVRMTCQGGS